MFVPPEDALELIRRIAGAAGVKDVQCDKLVIVLEVDCVTQLFIRACAKPSVMEVIAKEFEARVVKDVSVADDCTVKVVPHDA